MKSLVFAGALTLAAAPAFADDGAEIMAMDPYAYATSASAIAGGAYISLMNRGDADRLVGATGDVAKRVEVHQTETEDGVMKMRPVEGGLELPAEAELTMAPGGYHVMLMGLQEPLSEGESFPVTLEFESGETLTVDVPVIARGEAAPMAHHDRHESHSKSGDHSHD